MNVSEYITKGRERIQLAGLECADPTMHMRQIVSLAKEWDAKQLLLGWNDELTWLDIKKLEAMMERRLVGEPLQYIVGYEWFWDQKFKVGPGVLIPRRETEILIETLLTNEARTAVKLGELGAGTGNIAITALRNRPQWSWTAFESNPDSMPYLEENVANLLPTTASLKISADCFFHGAKVNAPYDWIVSNPPYVPAGEICGLSKEVQHEPKKALDGGPKGLDVIAKLISIAPSLLAPEGRLLLEIGSEQSRDVSALLDAAPGWNHRVIEDYAGHPRVVLAERG